MLRTASGRRDGDVLAVERHQAQHAARRGARRRLRQLRHLADPGLRRRRQHLGLPSEAILVQ
jgi:hypothetical protein